jgi:hypothetical protein
MLKRSIQTIKAGLRSKRIATLGKISIWVEARDIKRN